MATITFFILAINLGGNIYPWTHPLILASIILPSSASHSSSTSSTRPPTPVLLESPTASGLRLIIPSIAASSIGTLTGFLITWTRNLKVPLVLGASLYVIGTIGLVSMTRGLPNWMYVLLLIHIPTSMGQGFQMPGTFMSVLALVDCAEFVGGGFLNENVVGPDKEKVIEAVRSSVQAVAGLEKHYRDQVIDSYAQSLRAAYLFALVISMISLC
ncbi:hypothetical protein DID88_005445 [Monilinia fructigena]|uniref:Uncharacterized protein n=1 Tax=Monilinia fructigena TaxID=38457 RepID=A0A395IZW3_9HELO|nr:hypothetical protein DID88_005445 [Monilinia fructigena]